MSTEISFEELKANHCAGHLPPESLPSSGRTVGRVSTALESDPVPNWPQRREERIKQVVAAFGTDQAKAAQLVDTTGNVDDAAFAIQLAALLAATLAVVRDKVAGKPAQVSAVAHHFGYSELLSATERAQLAEDVMRYAAADQPAERAQSGSVADDVERYFAQAEAGED